MQSSLPMRAQPFARSWKQALANPCHLMLRACKTRYVLHREEMLQHNDVCVMWCVCTRSAIIR